MPPILFPSRRARAALEPFAASPAIVEGSYPIPGKPGGRIQSGYLFDGADTSIR